MLESFYKKFRYNPDQFHEIEIKCLFQITYLVDQITHDYLINNYSKLAYLKNYIKILCKEKKFEPGVLEGKHNCINNFSFYIIKIISY